MAKTKSINLDVMAEINAANKALKPALLRLTKALKAVDPKKLPIGTVSDLLYDLRPLKKGINAIADPFNEVLEPFIKDLETFFTDTLKVGESSGVQGMHSRTQITESPIPVVNDWNAFYAYITRTGSFELLNKQPNREAFKERWEQKKRIPGTSVFHAKKVSSTKLSGRS